MLEGSRNKRCCRRLELASAQETAGAPQSALPDCPHERSPRRSHTVHPVRNSAPTLALECFTHGYRSRYTAYPGM